jgi:WD repeat-containing protein 68
MDQEGPMGHGNAMMSEQSKVATNSNYLAPWSIYAYDWCKWAVPGGNSAGKMAVGSYLEDNHNFVSSFWDIHASTLTIV